MKIAFAATIFFLIFIAFELAYSLIRKPDSRVVNKAVARYASGLPNDEEISLQYHRKFSDIQVFNSFLAAIPLVGRLDELMQQGGVKMLAGVFILLSFTVGAVLLLCCSLLLQPVPISLMISSVGFFMPYLYLFHKRRQRKAQFESLFPDALDLMGYSLKAGHSIMASFRMVAEEMADPIGEEFRRVVDEINFGRDLDSTLRNFSRRIDSNELKFFATSVIIQRETGGNLVELLMRISEVIRRKFRFREKVKTVTGEAKLSAIILLALPFFAGAAILILNPRYIQVLFSDPIGPYAMATAVVMMSIGSFIMYKLVQLDM
ncbi:MAG TPA: type II secretion protein F [Desulfobulbaceae bacterium]|nr:type II secretion protein F [Desulfobulbaceae bacterium]